MITDSLKNIFDNKLEFNESEKTSLTAVIVCYNQEIFIVESISSIINQLHPGDEMIVIDDCSSDNTALVAKNCVEALQLNFRVRVYTKNKNKGINDSFNMIPMLTKNKNIISLAGDDFFYKGAVECIKKHISQTQEYSAIYSSCGIVDAGGGTIGYSDFEPDFKPNSIYELAAFGSSNVPGHSIACWNIKVIKEFGPFSNSVSNEDDQMIFRCSILGNIVIIDDRIRAYRKSSSSMSSPWTNFDVSVDSYTNRLIRPLKNKLNNYKFSLETIERWHNSEGKFHLDKDKIKDSLISCFSCLSTTIMLLETRKVSLRFLILIRYLIANGISKCVYYKQNLVIAVSHRLFYYLKKCSYRRKYNA